MLLMPSVPVLSCQPFAQHHSSLTAADEVHGHAGTTHTNHSALAPSQWGTPCNNSLMLVLWSHLTQRNVSSPWEVQPNQPPLHSPTKYLCIPRYRHTRLAVWLDPGNSHWQTGVHSRGHQGKGRGGSGHLIPGWGLHSSQPGTCTTEYTACRDCRQTHCSFGVNKLRFSTTVKKQRAETSLWLSLTTHTPSSCVHRHTFVCLTPAQEQETQGWTSALPLQGLSEGLQWLAKGLGSCSVLLATYAGTTVTCKAAGREVGIPTPINLQDH